jgi:hypothetical protein
MSRDRFFWPVSHSSVAGWYRISVVEITDQRRSNMPKYVIERDLPGAGKLTPAELRGVSQKSCGVLQKLGPEITWLQSYVTADKIYCVYIAPNEEMIREHARQGGFPANKISAVTSVIDPTTAEP